MAELHQKDVSGSSEVVAIQRPGRVPGLGEANAGHLLKELLEVCPFYGVQESEEPRQGPSPANADPASTSLSSPQASTASFGMPCHNAEISTE